MYPFFKNCTAFELGNLELGTKLGELGTEVPLVLGTKVLQLSLGQERWCPFERSFGLGDATKIMHYAMHPQICRPALWVSLWEIANKEAPSSVTQVLG